MPPRRVSWSIYSKLPKHLKLRAAGPPTQKWREAGPLRVLNALTIEQQREIAELRRIVAVLRIQEIYRRRREKKTKKQK